MFRFILFLGLLVGLAYVLTEPPAPERALSANEIPVGDDKPLLTSWGPTLGSLRNGFPSNRYPGTASTMVASNDASYGPDAAKTAANSDTPSSVAATAVVAAAQVAKPAPTRSESNKPARATTAIAENEPPTAEPAIDRIAAALPPQRRGLFGRILGPQRVQEPHVTRQAQADPAQARLVQTERRNIGLFKRLRERGKKPARAWTLGPAR